MSREHDLGGGLFPSWRRSPSPISPPSWRSSRSSRPSDADATGEAMDHWIPFWPDTAAINAVVVNNLYLAELGLSGVIMATVVAMMLTFCIRYRETSTHSRANLATRTWRFEILWTAATLGVFLVLFVWGAQVYIWLYKPPPADEEVYVVGKQWMWKVEHSGGQREINALHVP